MKVLCAVIGFIFCGYYGQAQNLESIKNLLKEGKFQDAENAIKPLKNDASGFEMARLCYLHGMAAKGMGNSTFALSQFEEAIELSDNYAAPLQQAALLIAPTRNGYCRSKDYYLKATSLKPKNNNFKYLYAKGLLKIEDYRNAHEILVEVEKDTSFYLLHRLLATTYLFEYGNYEQALEQLNKYSKNPDGFVKEDYVLYIKLYELSNDVVSAENWIKKAELKGVVDEALYKQAASLYKSQKDYAKHAQYLLKAYKLTNNVGSRELYELGSALYLAENYTSADWEFGQIALKYPSSHVGTFKQAQCQYHLKNKEQTAELYNKAVLIMKASSPEKHFSDYMRACSYLGAFYLNEQIDLAKS
ncbi:MAG: hypothetical protein KDC92_06160 [Bacteroidetes bacterium]|nr:hypothetical protein [Bacteroidota bacterium]